MAKDVDVIIENEAEVLRQLERAGIAIKDVLLEATMAAAEVLHDEAEPDAPGPYLEIQRLVKQPRKITVAVGPDRGHWYFRFFELGAQAHEIRPKRQKALKVTDDWFSARMAHPGMAARPFLRPAVDKSKDEILDVISKTIIDSLRKVAQHG